MKSTVADNYIGYDGDQIVEWFLGLNSEAEGTEQQDIEVLRRVVR